MSIKQRMTRAEKALNKGREQIEIQWIEPDENGYFPPPAPGAKVIDLNHAWENDQNSPGLEPAQRR